MAAQSLSSFVVGVGYEMDAASERQLSSSFSRVRKGATAITSALGGIAAATIAFAKADDKLSRWGDMWGLSAAAADAWGRVFSHSGSDFGGFASIVEQLSSNRAGLKAGDAGWIESWGANQLPPGISMQSDPQAMVTALADWFRGASRDQRINAAGVLGLDAGQVSTLSQGGASLRRQLAEELDRYQVTEEDVANARMLNEEMQNMASAFEGLGRAAGRIMAGPLGAFFRGMAGLAKAGTQGIEDTESIQKRMGSPGGATGMPRRDRGNPQSSNQPVILQLNGKVLAEFNLKTLETVNSLEAQTAIGAIS